ncbi:DoxX family protein [Nocardia sp. CNY236]|uniref:DoxX family protein n=1 Tax=Nocardia sp. CNY236 TaxID=1169152 RepID=UPI000491D359|nr:DoxX family protein [Nocardia sp. CNY236]
MTDKPNDGPGLLHADDSALSTAEQSRVSSTGRGGSGGRESPTDLLDRTRPAKRPRLTTDVPRTEEELGLDPEVPAFIEAGKDQGPAESAATGVTDTRSADTASGDTALTEAVPTYEPAPPDEPAHAFDHAALTLQDAAPGLQATAPIAEDTAPTLQDAAPTLQDAAPTYEYASIPPAPTPLRGSTRIPHPDREIRRGTLDLGLFIMRLVVGGSFLYHGLQKLTGWFHGSGLDGTRTMLEGGGWSHPTLSTILVTAGEVGGGALLILGLATPLAAGAILAVVLNAWAWKQGLVPGFQYHLDPGAVEVETVLAGATLAVVLTGPGRWSFDRNRGWATRPFAGSLVVAILAVAAAAGTYWYLHGGNPFVGIVFD